MQGYSVESNSKESSAFSSKKLHLESLNQFKGLPDEIRTQKQREIIDEYKRNPLVNKFEDSILDKSNSLNRSNSLASIRNQNLIIRNIFNNKDMKDDPNFRNCSNL